MGPVASQLLALLITRTLNKTPFVFREDGWFNMTKAAQHFGKDLSHLWRSPETRDYILAIEEIREFRGIKFFETQRGRNGGTWGHPKLAVFFARWLDVRFAVWCDAMIEDILKGRAALVVTKPAESVPSGRPMAALLRPGHAHTFAPKKFPGKSTTGFHTSRWLTFPRSPGVNPGPLRLDHFPGQDKGQAWEAGDQPELLTTRTGPGRVPAKTSPGVHQEGRRRL